MCNTGRHLRQVTLDMLALRLELGAALNSDRPRLRLCAAQLLQLRLLLARCLLEHPEVVLEAPQLRVPPEAGQVDRA